MTNRRTLMLSVSAGVAAAALALVLLPAPASACGGMFCSNGNINPASPVDQSAERILFDINGDGTITTTVQIAYAGEPSAFAWIVPVPSVPEVRDGDIDVLNRLDQATQMPVLLPQPEACPFTNSSANSGFGCGDVSEDSATSLRGGGTNESADGQKSAVTVYASSFTNTYEFSVIGAQNADDLVEWLQENEYNVSDNMIPVMQPYSSDGMVFLALKLRAETSENNLAPIEMTYEADFPMVPLQLTAVAAQPLMGIQVFIAGRTAYAPADAAWARPNTDEMVFDQFGTSNYFEWVARTASQAEGRHFVVEAVGKATTLGITGFNTKTITRLYTRMSPRFMNFDPRFVPLHGMPEGVSSLDFSDRQTIWDCNGPIADRQPSACGFNYCGVGASCSVDNGVVGCACASGDVAVGMTGPTGADTVTCVPAESPYGVQPADGMPDPCATTNCGEGVCVVRGGFATCACDPGAVARPTLGGGVAQCGPGGGQIFGPGAGAESAAAFDESQRGVQFAAPLWGPLMLALLFLFSRRRAASGRIG